MPKLLDAKTIIKRIVKETGKNEQEIRELIEEKKKKFAGLLTEDGAAFMVAKELNVDIEIKAEQAEVVKIANLSAGMRNIDLLARVLHVQAPRKFEKGARKGRYCRLLLGDETGEITLTLWNNDIKKIEKKKLERGAVILAKNCYVGTFNGKLTLALGFNGEIIVEPKGVDTSLLPKPERVAIKLADLSEGMQNIDVFARVLRVFEMREFEHSGEKANVIRFEIADGTARVQAVAWRDLAEKANKLYAGELIKIEGANVKSGLKGLELHLDWRSRIIEEPVVAFKIPELSELLGTKYTRKRISELQAGMQNIELVGEIVDIIKGNLVYYFCPTCKEKASGETCDKCGNKTRPRLVTTITLDDGSSAIACTMFGKQAELALQMTTIDVLNKFKEKDAHEVIEEAKKRALGRTILVRGNIKEHSLNPEELEMVVSEATPVNKSAEMERVLKSLSETSS
jgi:replication factor A1